MKEGCSHASINTVIRNELLEAQMFASAAANAGISDRLFQRHGKWKYVCAKDDYVADKLSPILSSPKC